MFKNVLKPASVLGMLAIVLSLLLVACGDPTATTAPVATTAAPAATTAAVATTAVAATTAAPVATTVAPVATTAATTATTAATTATTAATTTTTAATTATTAATTATTAAASTDGVNVAVNGTNVAIKAGGGKKYEPKAPVTVTIWSSQTKGNGVSFRALMDEFEKANPNIKIKVDNFNDTASYANILEKLTQSATAGGMPNLATGYENWVPQFVDTKLALPLRKFVEGEYGLSAKDLSDYRPQFIARGLFPQYQNEIYSWVFSNSGPVLFYNQDLLTQAGVTKIPETWDEFVAAGKAVTEKSAGKAVGFVYNPKTVSELVAGFYTRGGQVFDYKTNKLVYTDKPAVDHLTMLYQGVKDGWIATADPNVAFNDQGRFIKGESAFYISSTSSRSFVAAELAKEGAAKLNWNAQVLPHAGSVKPVTTLYGGAMLGFKGKTDDEDLATWEVMKFVGSASFQAKWASASGYVPATKSTVEDPIYKTFLEKAPQNKIPLAVYEYATASEPKVGQWEQLRKLTDDNVFALFQNANGNPAETLKKIEDEANKILSTAR